MNSTCILFSFIILVATCHSGLGSTENNLTTATEDENEINYKIRVCLKYTVHVMNGLGNNNHPLNIHCQSRDDDLGQHTLWVGGDFSFKFGVKLIGKKTWFTCDMVWGSKHQHVDVFRQHVEGDMCCETRTCYWKAQDDGIWFSMDNEYWLPRYDWLQ